MPKEPDIPKISGHPRWLKWSLISKQPTPQVLPCTCCDRMRTYTLNLRSKVMKFKMKFSR